MYKLIYILLLVVASFVIVLAALQLMYEPAYGSLPGKTNCSVCCGDSDNCCSCTGGPPASCYCESQGTNLKPICLCGIR